MPKTVSLDGVAPDEMILLLPDGLFGPWFSGLCDGESCFGAYMSNPTSPLWRFDFTLKMRLDDAPMILACYERFGAIGAIGVGDPGPDTQNPVIQWKVTMRWCRRIVNHFRQYPLLSKKRDDFLLWSQGVEHSTSRRASCRNRELLTRLGIAIQRGRMYSGPRGEMIDIRDPQLDMFEAEPFTRLA